MAIEPPAGAIPDEMTVSRFFHLAGRWQILTMTFKPALIPGLAAGIIFGTARANAPV
jgi:ABC-type phosphate transport system permease subunit